MSPQGDATSKIKILLHRRGIDPVVYDTFQALGGVAQKPPKVGQKWA